MSPKVLHKIGASEKCFVVSLWPQHPAVHICFTQELQGQVHTPAYYIKGLCDLILLTSAPNFLLFSIGVCDLGAMGFSKIKMSFFFFRFQNK